MAKTKAQKQETLTNLAAEIPAAKSIVFVNYAGLKAKEIEELRRQAEKEEMTYTVSKKTLMKRAFDESGTRGFDAKGLQGNIGMLFCSKDEVAAPKFMDAFRKNHEALKILGGILERKFIDAARVLELAKLPGRKELLAKMVGSLQSPISGLVNVLAGNLRGLVSALNAIKDKKS